MPGWLFVLHLLPGVAAVLYVLGLAGRHVIALVLRWLGWPR